jgi:hypothetical protein
MGVERISPCKQSLYLPLCPLRGTVYHQILRGGPQNGTSSL